MHAAVENRTLARVKNVLWGFMGVWAVVTVARFGHGIGATSGLTDAAPWGFWIAFDVMAGVALAAGGFVTAAAVYIFHLEKYAPLARPAILTALLGYIAVAVGLLYDLGIPWHIWHPMIFPQHHSVLFEVAMCVMTYLTVLALEFSPAVLEHPLFHHPFFQRLMKIIKKATIPLVIAGIVLSTLHQSSLGSLFLIQPYRVHPLWYSDIIYAQFFVSAIGLGLMMVTLEALISSWLFKHPIRMDLLPNLGRAAIFVLSAYFCLRVGDLWYRGVLPGALDGSWQAGIWILEMSMSTLIPIVLLSIPPVRHSIGGLATASVIAILGIIGYRFNLAIVAFARPDTMGYFPTWTEVAISIGVVSAAALVFIFLNENLRIVVDDPHADAPPPDPDAWRKLFVVPVDTRGRFTPQLRRHSLWFTVCGALAVAFLPEEAIFGPQPTPAPTHPARVVKALTVPTMSGPRLNNFFLAGLATDVAQAGTASPAEILLIDGNRNWRCVPFGHEQHIKLLGESTSCGFCHHQNLTFDRNSSCYQCHTDMYETADTFNHDLHIARTGDNRGCILCHDPGVARKTRENSLECFGCHGDMVNLDSFIKPIAGGLVGKAPGYVDAMHGLCINCHAEKAKEDPQRYAKFDRCDVCHRDNLGQAHQRMAPYVPLPPGHTVQWNLTTQPVRPDSSGSPISAPQGQ